jgi:drug/metabolite transporter (DMT)-like permease
MLNVVKRRLIATSIGYISLLLWSLSPLLISQLKNIPTYEILAIALWLSFSVIAIKLTLFKQWHRIKQPLGIWIIGVVGIYGNDLTYIAAFKYAPPAHVDLINYLWPILVILGSSLLPEEKFTFKHLLAGLLGLTGIYILLIDGMNLTSFKSSYLIGYGLALLDAIIWATYTLLARYHGKTPLEMIGMYCGIGALLSSIIHWQFEANVAPSFSQWLIIAAIGLTTSGGAYFLWDYGVKRGNFKLLSSLSYGNPILSILLLVMFQKAQASLSLALACVFVVAGAAVGSINLQAIRSYIAVRLSESALFGKPLKCRENCSK